jgi:2-methylcitrate dehydratase PrpD
LTLADRLAEHHAALRFDQLPRAVIDKAIELIGYDIALALRGHQNAEESAQAVGLARSLSPEGGPCVVIGTGVRAHPLDAAFANATLMRALECDDVMFPVGVHAGLVTTPAALALAEREHRSGRDLITAVVAGYSAIGKLGNGTAAWAAEQPRRPTIPFGPFGGAVACGLLLGLDAGRLANAIRYAAQFAMGLAEGTLWQHYYSVVARNGMFAAFLADAGGRVSETVLEGRFGFFETFFGAVPPAVRDTRLDGAPPIEILDTTTKRYPGTGLNIVGIELMRELVRSERIAPADVERIVITLPTERENFATGHLLTGLERWRACSSLPFQMAMVIVDGGETDCARYDEPDHPEIEAILSRVDLRFEAGHDDERFTRFKVVMRDGRHFVREGERYTFPPLDAAAEVRIAGRGRVPDARLASASELVRRLDEVGDVTELMSNLAT